MGRMVSCQFCGRELTVRNMERHLRQSCRVWDRGGGAIAVSGEWPEEEEEDCRPPVPVHDRVSGIVVP